MTRKLTIRTKLAAALAVPLIALATFAAFQRQSAVGRAGQVKHQAALAIASSGPAGALAALESEREYETLLEIGYQKQVGPSLQLPGDASSATNAALGDFRTQLHNTAGSAAKNYSDTLGSIATKLTALRGEAFDHLSKSATPATAKQANKIFDGYTELVTQLLDADQVSSASINDAKLRTGAELLNMIARQNDVETEMAVKSVLATVGHNENVALEVRRLYGRQLAGEDQLLKMSTSGGGWYQAAIVAPLTTRTKVSAATKTKKIDRADVDATLAAISAAPLHVNVTDVLRVAGQSTIIWHLPQSNTADVLKARSATLVASAKDEQQKWTLVTLGSVLLAIIVLWLANKWITRPMRSLAEQAAAMAQERLPQAVKQILETPLTEEVVRPDVAPVRVRAGGEVSDVEAALNRVQDSALELAVEQASLRRNVADAYVNLGRRNQNLLSRQLEFITQLESDESDPETLEHLFRLDHLATRMRRNAESLLVLAGHAPPRTWSAPVAVNDVVRGALGEVEGYQRVRLRHLDDARVDGTAAADVSHVVAELVENALAFSPPSVDVEIYGRLDEYGYVLTIVDSGIGMAPEDLERANALIQSASALTLAPSRFLGHYVVAQLAARHGLAVHLVASPTGGITAMVSMPAPLLGMQATPVLHTPLDAPAIDVGESAPEAPAALPRREPAAALAEPVAASPVESVVAPEPPPLPVLALAPEPEPAVLPEPEAAPRQAAWPDPEPELDQLRALQDDADVVPFAPLGEVAPPAPSEVALPVPEPVATESVTESVATAWGTPAPETEEPPARPRIGIGSFADLRSTPTSPRAPEPPAATPPVEPDAIPEPAGALHHPEVDAEVPVDRRATFADVADAVDHAAGRGPADLAPSPSSISEDFLPSLPKRGRRASRLQSPWSREKPAHSAPLAPPPAPPAPSPAAPPLSIPATAPADTAPALSANPSGGQGAVRFSVADNQLASAPPSHENENGASVTEPPHPNSSTSEGEDRFAFFAAFRQAAERAREEAGIDNRRAGH